jgi:hypothetical protein
MEENILFLSNMNSPPTTSELLFVVIVGNTSSNPDKNHIQPGNKPKQGSNTVVKRLVHGF